MRRATVIALVSILATTIPGTADDAAGWIRGTLRAAAADACGMDRAAMTGTLARMAGIPLPTNGKVLIVNIPAGVATAYEDGVPVIESRVVVGKDETRTPELDTVVTFVRPNPTWTVPQSIIARKGWRRKLAEDPAYFENAGFDIVVAGRTMSPGEAADRAESAETFVQRPGENNALGRLKIGIANSQAIYLHDTNEPRYFQEEVRLASSGCVRVERIYDVAAWILGIDPGELEGLVLDGDTGNHVPPETVKVVVGYWTAWPDGKGHVRVYPDVYGFDGDGGKCGPLVDSADTGREIWTEYEGQ